MSFACIGNSSTNRKDIRMGPVVNFLLFGIGLAIIIKGSDWFINSVIYIAKVFKIPYIIIGVTIVSICTSLPETFVSAAAALKEETDVAFGNAMGSIAINTGVILAILMIFSRSIVEDHKDIVKNGIFLISTLVLTLIIGLVYGQIHRFFGFLLFALFLLYILKNVYSIRKKKNEERTVNGDDDEYKSQVDVSRYTVIRNIIFFLIGISMVILGSNLLVDNGIKIAEILKIPTILIAIIFTSLGTSLPELVTTISSIRKGVSNLGVGNIIGANILNIIQVLSISSIIRDIPLAHDSSILFFQLPLVLAMVSASVLFCIISKKRFRRWYGFVLFGFYSIFLVVNLFRENTPLVGALIFG